MYSAIFCLMKLLKHLHKTIVLAVHYAVAINTHYLVLVRYSQKSDNPASIKCVLSILTATCCLLDTC